MGLLHLRLRLVGALLLLLVLGLAGAAFTCDGGARTLADGQMNDNFCDCEDGSDEPATAACSLVRRDQAFVCTRSADGLPHRLFTSRVGDGICDCCDGSDEAEGVCPDACEALAQSFVQRAQAEYKTVLDGWLNRNEALAGVKATMGEWEAEAAAIERNLAGYAPVVAHLKAYRNKEEKVESWEKLAWLREQAHLKQQQQKTQPQAEPMAEPEPEPEADMEAVAAQAQEQEQRDEESGEVRAAPDAQHIGPAERVDESLKVRVLYDEEEGLNGVERVLRGMTASRGGRSLSLKDYLEEQEQVAKGLKQPQPAPSVGSVLSSGSLDPHDIIEMNLQAIGALVIGPFKAIGWSFSVCLEELYAAMGWSWKDPFHKHQFHSSRHLQQQEDEAAAPPLVRWWREKVKPTTLGWVVTSFLQGPDAAVALLRPDTIEGAPERLEAALLHAAVDKIEEEMRKMRDRAQELRAGLSPSSAYGPDHVFLAWQDKCFEREDKEHKYEVCPFKEAKQGWVLVGKWAGWGKRRPAADAGDTVVLNKPEDVGRSMFFNEGQQCWNGPKRSAAVELKCGREDRIVEVSEPSVCVYDLVMETPLLCDESLLSQAEARLAALGVPIPQAEEE